MQDEEIRIDKEAADYLEGYLVGIYSAKMEDPTHERTLDPDNDDVMDGFNWGFSTICSQLGKDPLRTMERMDDHPSLKRVVREAVRRIRVRNGAETQIWNDAAKFFHESVGTGEELIIPVLPGRTLLSMWGSMTSALKRRGLHSAKVVQTLNSRARYVGHNKWEICNNGKPCLIITRDKYQCVVKQYNFFDECGGAVVYIKDEPFFGEFLGEESGRLKFVLIMGDGERVVKFSPGYCNKVGQYAWKVNG